MTKDQKWRIAKWLKRHGRTKRSDVPKWVPPDLLGDYGFFHVYCDNLDSGGYPVLSEDDIFAMADADMDAFQAERLRRRGEFRANAAIVISLAALIVSLIALMKP